MYIDKGILTKDELTLIARYPDKIQSRLEEEVLKAKEVEISSFSYDNWIKWMETGKQISFDGNVTSIGDLNTYRLARKAVEMEEGFSIEPHEKEIDFDDRIESFKQYPKGSRVRANGDLIKREE
ncbi:hypothetical protein [Guptibacillus spartinae]|uniref:hypothetical protein n=1 Tax=Guptibacillus spartinae TaxID=3025679 RepID=UPI0023601E1A|nr:hypothetical protein [Pseudalkalibacillus spartinae]